MSHLGGQKGDTRVSRNDRLRRSLFLPSAILFWGIALFAALATMCHAELTGTYAAELLLVPALPALCAALCQVGHYWRGK